MKVLAISSHFYDEQHTKTKGLITGLGIMLRDIFEGVSQQVNCLFLTTNMVTKDKSIGNIKMFSALKGRNLLQSIKIKDCISVISLLIKGYTPRIIKQKILASKSIERLKELINEEKPDIINLHDLGYINREIAHYCSSNGIRCVITIHLYIGNNTNTYGYNQLKENEDSTFNLKGLYYSVVSSGIKKRILLDHPNILPDQVFVIVNGSNFVDNIKTPFTALSATNNKKTLLCIGTICERKNQLQIIRAVKKMTPEEREGFEILFFGSDNSGKFQEQIDQSGCGNTLHYMGKITQSQLQKYYQSAFGTITVSKNEGFGLTVIEGYSYGLPAIFNADLDSSPDLFSPDACLTINDNTDETLRNTILNFLSIKWNPQIICEFAKKFSMKEVCNHYVNMYNQICKH